MRPAQPYFPDAPQERAQRQGQWADSILQRCHGLRVFPICGTTVPFRIGPPPACRVQLGQRDRRSARPGSSARQRPLQPHRIPHSCTPRPRPRRNRRSGNEQAGPWPHRHGARPQHNPIRFCRKSRDEAGKPARNRVPAVPDRRPGLPAGRRAPRQDSGCDQRLGTAPQFAADLAALPACRAGGRGHRAGSGPGAFIKGLFAGCVEVIAA